jgi:4-amino-4-deoxy-L-arabinose transferase-like glycosyltransferase
MTEPLASVTTPSMSGQRDRRCAVLVIAVALLVRATALLDGRDAPFWRTPLVDETTYLDLARGLLHGTPPPHGTWYVTPGYAYVLAAVLRCGGGIVAAKLVNLLAGVVTVWLVWKLSRRVASSAAACVAACAWALFPAALLQELLVLKTALAVLCVLLAVLAVPWPEPSRHATWVRWSGAGAAVGAAALLRGEWLVLAPMLAFAAWLAAWRRWPAAPPRLAPVVMLAVAALAVAVPTLQNRARSGDWVLLAYGGGPNFYIGNRPDADGGYVPLRPDRSDPPQEEADAVALASLGLGHAASPAEVSRWWYGRGVAWWREAPLRALRLTGKKWAMLWGPWEMSDVLSTRLAAHWVHVLRDPLATPALWLPPALAGLWISRRRRELWPLHAALAAAQLAIVPFFLFERFRLPFVALALPFAALAATHAATLVAARHGRRLVVGTGVMLAAAAAIACVRAPRDEAVLHVNLGEMLYEAGDYRGALREYEIVRRDAPHAWRVDINIANTYVALRDPAPALAALQRVLPKLEAEAVRTHLPSAEELAYCHELAGDLEQDGGDPLAAAKHYERALQFAPAAARDGLRAKLAACNMPPAPPTPAR